MMAYVLFYRRGADQRLDGMVYFDESKARMIAETIAEGYQTQVVIKTMEVSL